MVGRICCIHQGNALWPFFGMYITSLPSKQADEVGPQIVHQLLEKGFALFHPSFLEA